MDTRTGGFILYVEGARDQEVLAGWARRAAPELLRCLERNTVILGGRQPARALSDFEKRGGKEAGLRGLIVLDRDDREVSAADEESPLREAGLEVFVWSLRHIESYLLVPEAIRRALGLPQDDPRVERALEALTSESDSTSTGTRTDSGGRPRRSLHAKRVLGVGGALSEALGAPLHAGAIAKAMSTEDLHEDIRALFERMRSLAGLAVRGPEVVIRRVVSPKSDGLNPNSPNSPTSGQPD